MAFTEQRWFLGTLAEIKIRGEDVGDRLALVELLLPRGASPPLHTHPQDESYYVLEGRMRLRAGADEFELGPGDAAVATMGTAHSFLVESDTARVLVLSTPAGIERMIRDGSTPAAAATLPSADAPRPSPDVIDRVFAAHGTVVVGPPLDLAG